MCAVMAIDITTMLHRKRVTSVDDCLFQFAWDLYVASFPEQERRELDYQREALEVGEFYADVVLESDKPIGILFWWSLSDLVYVEHLATSPAVRGRGYGDRILRELIERSDKPIILEVEHPTCEMSRRRIGFYERVGFTLSDLHYSHPSYQQPSDERVELMIMTHPQAITEHELAKFTSKEFPKIHFRAFQ